MRRHACSPFSRWEKGLHAAARDEGFWPLDALLPPSPQPSPQRGEGVAPNSGERSHVPFGLLLCHMRLPRGSTGGASGVDPDETLRPLPIDMIVIEPRGRPHISCPRCKAFVIWPTTFTANEKSLLAAEVRSGPISGIRFARSQFELDLREAKAPAFHITLKRLCRTASVARQTPPGGFPPAGDQALGLEVELDGLGPPTRLVAAREQRVGKERPHGVDHLVI
jgi:hypothetical protein